MMGKRASRPKVRTGCFTCRARRIKCDEQKPSCLRCIKHGTVCSGYAPTDGSDKSQSKALREIAPRNDPGPLLSFSNIHHSRFKDDWEFDCFKLFCERTVLNLVGSDDSDLWSKTVLQASEEEEAFRHAAIAIGALDRTLEMFSAKTTNCPVYETSTQDARAQQYQFALKQYDKFIVQVRTRLIGNCYDLRRALISCILVVCFEMYVGNLPVAMNHVQAGLAFIKKAFGESNLGSWNASGIDTGLIQIFLRLDEISLSSALQSMTGTCVHRIQAPDVLVHGITREFESCKEAAIYWKLIARRISMATGGDEHHDSSQMPFLGRSHDVTHPPCPASTLGYLRQWSAAFQPLLQSSRTEIGESYRLKAAVLQLRHNTTLLACVGSKLASELIYDNFMHVFKESLELATEILGGPGRTRPIFTFDIAVIGILWLVATKCRDNKLRWSAVALLLTHPRREGVWDGTMVAEFASVLVRLEEVSLENGTIPESARLRAESFSFDLSLKQGNLIYSRSTSPGAERVIESVDISWSW